MTGMAKRKNNTGRARDEGEVKFVGAELETALVAAIEKCMEQERRTKRAVITLALEEYLTKAGLWPPQGLAAPPSPSPATVRTPRTMKLTFSCWSCKTRNVDYYPPHDAAVVMRGQVRKFLAECSNGHCSLDNIVEPTEPIMDPEQVVECTTRKPTREELFFAELGDEQFKRSLAFTNETLGRLLTLSTALLAGSIAFFAGRAGWQALA